jgi:hypothetical protein
MEGPMPDHIPPLVLQLPTLTHYGLSMTISRVESAASLAEDMAASARVAADRAYREYQAAADDASVCDAHVTACYDEYSALDRAADDAEAIEREIDEACRCLDRAAGLLRLAEART